MNVDTASSPNDSMTPLSQRLRQFPAHMVRPTQTTLARRPPWIWETGLGAAKFQFKQFSQALSARELIDLTFLTGSGAPRRLTIGLEQPLLTQVCQMSRGAGFPARSTGISADKTLMPLFKAVLQSLLADPSEWLQRQPVVENVRLDANMVQEPGDLQGVFSMPGTTWTSRVFMNLGPDWNQDVQLWSLPQIDYKKVPPHFKIRLSPFIGSSRITLTDLKDIEVGDFLLIENWNDANNQWQVILRSPDNTIVLTGYMQDKGVELSTSTSNPNPSSVNQPTSELVNASQLDGLKVQLNFELPEIELPVSEVMQLTPGMVVPLNAPVDQAEVYVRTGGELIAIGQLVALGPNLGIHIMQTRLTPATSRETSTTSETEVPSSTL
jgi:type III secretion system YscQ/HrcQ family protein